MRSSCRTRRTSCDRTSCIQTSRARIPSATSRLGAREWPRRLRRTRRFCIATRRSGRPVGCWHCRPVRLCRAVAHRPGPVVRPVPPTAERLEWGDLVQPDLKLFFEVGLPSPLAYRSWLAAHLGDRQALVTQRIVAEARGDALEGRTHLDALLMSPSSGFALHFEAKVLSDQTSTRRRRTTASEISWLGTSTAWRQRRESIRCSVSETRTGASS